MSYGGWPAYVPVAQRRAKALRQMTKLKKKGKHIQPILIEGKAIAKTFWGKGWCKHLEQFSDYSNRLPRGRSYVRNGSVCHLKIHKGKIEAIVSGSKLYNITIKIKPLTDQKWKKIQQQCSGQIGSMLELLQGKLSNSIMNVVTHPTEGLFPLSNEIELDCNCPDWAELCKHLAAVLYGVGARLDETPELLFLLRGVDHTHLITDIKIPTTRSKEHQTNKRQIKGDIGDIFGIELDETIQKNTVDKPVKKSVKKRSVNKKTTLKKNIRPTGKTITRLRRHFGMSLSQFAQLLGVSPATISNWEKKPDQLSLKSKNLERLVTIVDLTKAQAWDKINKT
jgi:uncharacterized Zn finger protein